jgi:hypothetical protein
MKQWKPWLNRILSGCGAIWLAVFIYFVLIVGD